MRVGVAAILLVGVLFAGCSGSASSKGGELVVTSEAPPVDEVGSGDPADQAADPVTETPKKGTRGHLAGVVVDEAIRPIEGATVRLPGLDLTETTDRNGAFSFTDLYVGPYLTTANATGYYGAETVLTVKADEFSRVKFVLTAVPPPEPYHFTQKFDGFADITDLSTLSLVDFCSTCTFDLYAGGTGFHALLVEATMEEYSGSTSLGSNNFNVELGLPACCASYVSGDYANPARVDIRVPTIPEAEQQYRLSVHPEAFPQPELSKEFQVFVTHWYNQDPPAEWSFLAGDT
jgi:hypothetical protein